MGYFGDVYLKRVNRYGETIQERLQNKREHDFLFMMQKSPNKVDVWENNKPAEEEEHGDYEAVLQTKEYDVDQVIDYMLVPCDREIPMGTLLWTKDIRHGLRENPFMNYAIDPYTTQGYNRYTVIELEEELKWIVNGQQFYARCHAAGGGSGARDKNINLKFKTQFEESGVYLPNKRYSLIMPTDSVIFYDEETGKEKIGSIKKNMRVTLGGETWRITGFDKISVHGVIYITLEEALTDNFEDKPVANNNELLKWNIVSNYGQEFSITSSGISDLQFYCYYNDESEPSEVEVEVTPSELNVVEISCEGGQWTIEPIETTTFTEIQLNVRVKNVPESTIQLNMKYQESSEKSGIVQGPRTITVGETVEYLLLNVPATEVTDIILDNDSATIVDKGFNDDNILYIRVEGNDIGKNAIISENTEFNFNIDSVWLGGGR